MSDNVVRFTGVTRSDLDPDMVLREAIGKLEGCFILGYGKDGSEYFAGSYACGAKAVYLAERFKKLMIDEWDVE